MPWPHNNDLGKKVPEPKSGPSKSMIELLDAQLKSLYMNPMSYPPVTSDWAKLKQDAYDNLMKGKVTGYWPPEPKDPVIKNLALHYWPPVPYEQKLAPKKQPNPLFTNKSPQFGDAQIRVKLFVDGIEPLNGKQWGLIGHLSDYAIMSSPPDEQKQLAKRIIAEQLLKLQQDIFAAIDKEN